MNAILAIARNGEEMPREMDERSNKRLSPLTTAHGKVEEGQRGSV